MEHKYLVSVSVFCRCFVVHHTRSYLFRHFFSCCLSPGVCFSLLHTEHSKCVLWMTMSVSNLQYIEQQCYHHHIHICTALTLYAQQQYLFTWARAYVNQKINKCDKIWKWEYPPFVGILIYVDILRPFSFYRIERKRCTKQKRNAQTIIFFFRLNSIL